MQKETAVHHYNLFENKTTEKSYLVCGLLFNAERRVTIWLKELTCKVCIEHLIDNAIELRSQSPAHYFIGDLDTYLSTLLDLKDKAI